MARVSCERLTDERQIRTLVERFYADAWDRWDDRAVDELLTSDFAFRGSLGDHARGRDGFRAYRDKVRSAFPDFRNEVVEIVADAERAAVRLRCSGRHDGELFGVAATGVSVSYDVAAFLRARDVQLCEVWALGNLEELRSQLSPLERGAGQSG
jgi:predicted ester cyclase